MFDLITLHQKLIHFPIAFLFLYPFAELFALIRKSEFTNKLSFIFLLIGLISLFLAILSGNNTLNSFKDISEKDLAIINKHIDYANYLAWLSGFLFLMRIYYYQKIKINNIIRVIIILLSIVILFFVIKTAEYGGLVNELLFNYKKDF